MSSRYRYSLLDPLNNKAFVTLDFGKFACTVLTIPFTAFFFCIIWSLKYNFTSVTYTHCEVYNFLPSLSSAIGSFDPQKTVWRAAIFLQFIPRIMVCVIYSQYYADYLQATKLTYNYIICTANILENVSLLGLSYWSSNEDYEIHKFNFIVFLITSEIHMIAVCVALQKYPKYPMNAVQSRSLKVKWKLFAVNITALTVALYFYYRHQQYCEAGVYSMFALAEYLVVLTNMAFHMTAFWDFYDKRLVVERFTKFYIS